MSPYGASVSYVDPGAAGYGTSLRGKSVDEAATAWENESDGSSRVSWCSWRKQASHDVYYAGGVAAAKATAHVSVEANGDNTYLLELSWSSVSHVL